MKFGEITVNKIEEFVVNNSSVEFVYPYEINSESVNVDSHINLSCHSWLVRTSTSTILIDTCTGNDKERPFHSMFHHLNTPWLENLSAAGVTPEQVDYVLLTHTHIDHVGWNTILVNNNWIPTFPKAKYIFSKAELEHYRKTENIEAHMVGVFEDSIYPIVDSGNTYLITDENTLPFLPGFTFHRTPGHSIDHYSITLDTEDGVLLFGGDVIQHELQISHPELKGAYDYNHQLSHKSREWLLNYSADTNAFYFSSHCTGTSVGKIIRSAGGFIWQPLSQN